MAGLPRVTLYGRAGCHLCDDARALLERLAPRLGFAIDEVDIDTRPDLLALYDVAVPVIVAGDTEIARAPLDASAVERALIGALGAG